MRILKQSRKLPAESTIRFVMDGAGHVYGCIGLARDLMETKIVEIGSGAEYYDPDVWLAVRTIGHHDVIECVSREEAVAEFKEAQE